MTKKKSRKKVTQYDHNPLAYVADSSIHGHGLFARKTIAKNEHIGTYDGKPTQDDGMHVLWLLDEESNQWEGIDGHNEMRFLNHSEQPNADFWNDELYALKSIKKDEEITFDYQWDEQE